MKLHERTLCCLLSKYYMCLIEIQKPVQFREYSCLHKCQYCDVFRLVPACGLQDRVPRLLHTGTPGRGAAATFPTRVPVAAWPGAGAGAGAGPGGGALTPRPPPRTTRSAAAGLGTAARRSPCRPRRRRAPPAATPSPSRSWGSVNQGKHRPKTLVTGNPTSDIIKKPAM